MTARLTKHAGEARVAAGSREQPMQSSDMPIAKALASALVAAVAMGAAACTPTVRIEASDKPITINLNVKIDQEVRYRLDKDLEDAIAKNPDLF